jgi:hypothetical protein
MASYFWRSSFRRMYGSDGWFERFRACGPRDFRLSKTLKKRPTTCFSADRKTVARTTGPASADKFVRNPPSPACHDVEL